MKLVRKRYIAAISLAATVVAMGSSSAMASNGTVPFDDPHTNGTLTFCDKTGHAVTSGDIRDIPFVYQAVSSTPAPPAWQGPFGKATLYVFQPRENVDPGLWSGRQMTGSSQYTNMKNPIAQATNADPALASFTDVAPLWRGLVQLRMYYSNVDTMVHSIPYPAAILSVSGTKWTLISGGGAPCRAGTAVSNETQQLPASSIPTAPSSLQPAIPGAVPVVVGGAKNSDSGSAPTPAPSAGASRGAQPGAPVPNADSTPMSSDGAAGGSQVPVAAANDSGSSSGGGLSPLAWLALLLIPIAALAGGVFLGRRSGGQGSHSATQTADSTDSTTKPTTSSTSP